MNPGRPEIPAAAQAFRNDVSASCRVSGVPFSDTKNVAAPGKLRARRAS